MLETYVIIDANGVAINTVLWDGISDWSPPEGCTIALIDSDEAQVAIAAAQLGDA